MREYGADLVSRSVARLGEMRVEVVRRRLVAGAPAAIHVALDRHAIYVELSTGLRCERRVAGGAPVRFVTEPGLVSFRPAGAEVRGSTAGDGIVTYGVVLIDPRHDWLDALRPALRPVTALRSARVWAEIAPLLAECAADACETATPARPFAALYAQGRGLALLAALADESGAAPPAGDGDARVAAALAWIDDNLTREFSLADLAEAVHLSASQLVRVFGRALGVTPMRYVSARRVREAQRLLAQSNWPVARIAAHLGYVDQSHFTQRFRSNVGATPAAWRRRARGG
ncbi:helix-turn-helix transcriptional regulator [Burkholderia plantarii]|uniref:Putative transcriptional regulator n=2 Tax=Burkholderia plantarii TaxID=41899 RepID=A0A0B6SCI9_BURPL|nr:AraC family transcriptional regulator [Burkholderia plantarii]AJK49966.1 putative transcriptional regulator [Burkholderia plantarii]WLE63197.1 helix-turn-helix transcriptional regulator [Burkholderia plantarii]